MFANTSLDSDICDEFPRLFSIVYSLIKNKDLISKKLMECLSKRNIK